MGKTSNSRQKLIFNIGAILMLFIFLTILMQPGILSRQYRALIVPIAMNIVLAVSLNLLTGFLGELTLGHAGFMAIGAYTGAIFCLNVNMPQILAIVISVILGGIVAGIFGFLIGVPVLRLRGDYLAIVTLAFGEIIRSVLNSLSFTGGPNGLKSIPKYLDSKNYIIVYIIVVISVVLICNLVKSRQGRAISSIRDNYIAAESVGIPVSKFKVLAFVISAFFAGVAGVIYSLNYGIVNPKNFSYNKSIEILVIVVLGGMGNIKGSIIGAIILTMLPEVLRGMDSYRMLLYALILILIMLFNNSSIKEKMKTVKTKTTTKSKEVE